MLKKATCFLSVLFFCSVIVKAGSPSYSLVLKTVAHANDTVKMSFVSNAQLFAEHWDTLPQVKFWQEVIKLSADTAIVNVAATRKPLQKVAMSDWSCRNETDKNEYKKFTCLASFLPETTNLYVTAGKKEFYEYKRVIPFIGPSVKTFLNNDVDPWYAQTILLIENPGKNHNKSYVGANGPFQLMKSVAVRFGLRVNKKVDERTDLNKAALAASKLLKTICIPKVKELLDVRNIQYNETDLWFRLLVLHAYHAGAGNVACVINELNPQQGGVDLFKKIWITECRGFKNESQNYSQIALANLVQFEKFISQHSDSVWLVEGDRNLAAYKKAKKSGTPNIQMLTACINAYSNDLIDGTIETDYFISRMSVIQRELASQGASYQQKNNFPVSLEQFLAIGGNLLRKRKLDDAIKILKLNIEHYPNCAGAYDSLSRAYSLKGKKQLAEQYSLKGQAVKNTPN